MDRNSAIGLTLIAGMLLIYFYWFNPREKSEAGEDIATADSIQTPSADTVKFSEPPVYDSIADASYGNLSAFRHGISKITDIETEDVKISFDSHGGKINFLELKKYKTYFQKPLILISPTATSFKLLSSYEGKEIDLYNLYYETEQQEVNDTTVVTFRAALADGSSFVQRYAIPHQGYEIGYSLESKGFDSKFTTDQMTLVWDQFIQPTEKDITDTRNNTTVNYYLAQDGFDDLSAKSSSTEEETLSSPLKWVSIKEKFFLSALIAEGDNEFTSAKVKMTPGQKEDTSLVKLTHVELAIAKKNISNKRATFKYYIGPNDYQVIGDVAPDFSKNVYLGWPPVYWVNKFVIFPVFHFLTLHIANYGIIILILVFLLRAVLAPLSYRSFLSMAKMKVLKPELDEIKEKHGDDQQKVQQEQLKLYQQVGVNPISGCIPVVLQMPILFAMFYLFPASIELRQQPLLWAEDLSTYDSLIHFSFSLPFLGNHLSLFTVMMTGATLIYTWQNNQVSSVQGPMKSMSYIMPLVFFFVLNSFSAGLTFYYFVSTMLTFAQQVIIKRFVNEDKIKQILEENKKKNKGSKGKKSKFMSKLEDAIKASEEAKKSSSENRKKKGGK